MDLLGLTLRSIFPPKEVENPLAQLKESSPSSMPQSSLKPRLTEDSNVVPAGFNGASQKIPLSLAIRRADFIEPLVYLESCQISGAEQIVLDSGEVPTHA